MTPLTFHFDFSLRQKLGDKENSLTANVRHGFAQEFEKSEPVRRLRLVISELLFIASHVSCDSLLQLHVPLAVIDAFR